MKASGPQGRDGFALEDGGLSYRFPPDPAAVRQARLFVIEALVRGGFPDDVIEDAALVVTELATNAVLHSRSAFTVLLDRALGCLRVAVRDASTVAPVQMPGNTSARSGRGVALVSALSRRWGTEMSSEGKVVWAELG